MRDEHLERLEYWLDRAFRVPGTDNRFGGDAIIGLIPGIGDSANGVIFGVLILAALRAGAPKRITGKMVLNVVIDWLVGLIPVVGDLFDVAHRANTKNLVLLQGILAQRSDEDLG
jgi:hypothetical protein